MFAPLALRPAGVSLKPQVLRIAEAALKALGMTGLATGLMLWLLFLLHLLLLLYMLLL